MTPPSGFLLETERLRLREYRDDDLEALHAIQGDPIAWSFYPHPYSIDESRAWIADNRRRYREDGVGMWAMELASDGSFVGSCGPAIRQVDGVAELELGWHVARRWWNRGLATEAASACRDRVFGELGRRRLISLVRPENAASCRVAEKIGMTVERETIYGSFLHRVYAVARET